MKTEPTTQPETENTSPDELLFRDVFRQDWIDAIETHNAPRGLILIDESIVDVFVERWLWNGIAERPGPSGRSKESKAVLDAFGLWPFARTEKDDDICAANCDRGEPASRILDAPRLLAAGIAETRRVGRPNAPMLLVAKMEHTPAFPAIARLFTHVWTVVRNFPGGDLGASRSITAVRIMPDVRTGFLLLD